MVSGQYFDRLRLHSQVKMLYKVKFSKLEFCQSDCRFEILAKNCVKKVSFFFQNFDQNIVKINIIRQNKVKFRQKSNFTLFWTDDANFDCVPLKISKKEKHFLLIVFSKDFKSAIRILVACSQICNQIFSCMLATLRPAMTTTD